MCKLLSGIGGNSSNMPTTPKLRQRGEVNSPFLCLRVNGGSLIYKLNIGEETPVLDKLVFHKIKERLGGRIRLMVSGSAPLSPALHEFLEVYVYLFLPYQLFTTTTNSVFCCPVLQGYGLSETAACCSISDEGSKTYGHVGLPVACNGILPLCLLFSFW